MLRGWTARFLPPVLHEPCGPTPVLGVHGIVTYARFSKLKKPDFNPVLDFHGPTFWAGLSLKTVPNSHTHIKQFWREQLNDIFNIHMGATL